MAPPSVTEKGAESRRRIVAAAADCFLGGGYGGTSLTEILGAAGCTKGGFYFHFASKAELALEVLESTRASFREDVMALAGAHERAVDQIVAMIRAVAAQKRAAPAVSALWRLCQDVSREPDVDPGRVRPYEDWIEVTEALLRRASDQGDLDPQTDVAAAARFAVSAYAGMDQLTDLAGVDLSEAAVEDYIRFVFRAVGLRPPDEAPSGRSGPGTSA